LGQIGLHPFLASYRLEGGIAESSRDAEKGAKRGALFIGLSGGESGSDGAAQLVAGGNQVFPEPADG
jgi:hypothetical protein